MSTVGQIEKKTQRRIVELFRDTLGYDYLGDWTDREGNSNIEESYLRPFLQKRGYSDTLIKRALYKLNKAAGDTSKSLYDRNRAVYDLLRYAVKVRPDVGENTQDVWLIDWKHPEKNHFAVAEEVTVPGNDARAYGKRPDVVLYVNGIALGVLELKRSTVSVAEGIRQNLDNQKKVFIERFFSTMQLLMAGNDTEGLRYGSIETQEKYYLTWKEEGGALVSGVAPGFSPACAALKDGATSAGAGLKPGATLKSGQHHEERDEMSLLDRALIQICNKARFLELIHDFIVLDAGTKKLCRHNQYFGVRAAQTHVKRREGGIIWHTQGSGKSLTMVWLTKWIRENVKDARVLIITDRTELDEQIEKVFLGVNEKIYRTKSGADLIAKLNETTPWLLCSLVHKFGGKEEGEEVGDIPGYIEEVKKALPPGFKAKGDLYVFVDECHRTQSGELHEAMKAILPGAVFIGFTGTPLLKADKKRSIEVFGRYIHTYKFDEAVKDGVVLDLQYEARDIDQNITSQAKIDQWFEAKTKGLTDLAKAQLKQRWGTLRKVLSSQSRLQKIVADILMDMETRPRLMNGRGNAILVSGSIYQACKLYELFDLTDLAGQCAIVTSYRPSPADIKGEESGEGLTERLRQYDIYKKMLADWFDEAPETAVNRAEKFEKEAKKKFIEEPGQMKLLIVVDKLLTGFDAPPATYLYIDKQMRDHGLFQAICRVNRLDGDDKDYGYIVDYKDLFKSLETSFRDYTSGALDGYDREDVAGLLEDRLAKARERLEEAREAVKALCEPVETPQDSLAYFRYFSAKDSGNAEQLKENEPKRLSLYTLTASLVRAYANLANEMEEAGYRPAEIRTIKAEVKHFENVRDEVKKHSGDAIDLKMYEPAMRLMIDTYIQAEDSETVSAFEDMSLVQLIVELGAEAVDALPKGIRENKEAVAETIENNVRKLIIDEQPINPKYYEKMSELLDALIKQRKQEALDYQNYLKKIVELTKQAKNGPGGAAYPKQLNTPAKRALYDNLGKDEALALAVDVAMRASKQDDWRSNAVKVKKVMLAIKRALEESESQADVKAVLELVKNQNEY
ncbi:MAG: HsdR family type I site-specific deoxyribonuclease [Terriglobia bacterium]|jgi:type I restriction enzyme R subunit